MDLNNFTILELVEHLQFDVEKIVSNNAMIKCPHHADGKEENASCGVHLDTGVYHCFTCNANGHITHFLSPEELQSYNQNQESARSTINLKEILQKSRKRNTIPQYKSIEEYKKKREKIEIDYETSYCKQRGVSEEVFNQFFIIEKDNEVIFPNVNQYGRLISYGIRRIDSKVFYFRTPYDFSVEKISFGEYQVRKEKEITIVEGYFDALRLWTLGYPAIALQGVGSNAQTEQLLQSSHRLINLCLDNDPAGRRAGHKLQQALSQTKYVKMIQVPDPYKDVGEMKDIDIHSLFYHHGVQSKY